MEASWPAGLSEADRRRRVTVKGGNVPTIHHDNLYYETTPGHYGTMQSALAKYVQRNSGENGKSPEQLAEQVAWLTQYQEPDLPPQRRTSPTGLNLPIGFDLDHLSSTSS